MKRFVPGLFLILLLSGCNHESKVTIRGSLSEERDGVIYLDRSEVNYNSRIDSAVIKRGRFRFVTNIRGPEFFQLRFPDNEFAGLLVMPGEKVNVRFGGSPLTLNYTVDGSPGSEEVRFLDQQLFKTQSGLDSLRRLYSSLDSSDLSVRGAELEEQFSGLLEAQRRFNIKFIVENLSSMSAIQALYQRIDDENYVLYHPRDLQYLKIVSDTLSVKYPVSRHVKALKENVTSELNRMYVDRMVSLASEMPVTNIIPELRDINGKMVSLASLKGKYVLLSFWSTTSQESLDELPLLRSLYDSYHRKGLEIYQVSLDVDEQRWRNMVKFEEIPWISVREEEPQNPYYARLLNITSIPSNLLYDREGNIINTNLSGRNLRIRLDQLLNK